MNERRDNWAQAFGESVSIAAIGFGLLGITLDHAARFRSAKRVLGSLRDHAALFLGERSMILTPPREKKLLRRFAPGKTNRQIAGGIGGTEQQVRIQRPRPSNLANEMAALPYSFTS